MRAVVIFTFIAAASVVFSQGPPRCKAPRQWRGNVLETTTLANLSARFQRFFEVAYDLEQKRIFLQDKNTDLQYAEWWFYGELESYGYRFDKIEGNCIKFHINEAFHPIEIPEFATFISIISLGMADMSTVICDSLLVQMWAGKDSHNDYTGLWMPFSQDTEEEQEPEYLCAPVLDVDVSPNVDIVKTWQFSDIEMGIDPAIFTDLPEQCSQLS